MQVREVEAELRHKLFPLNAWMKVTDFNVLTSCPKDELHQWFIGLYGEHIIPAIVYRYTQVLQRPDLITLDKNGNSHPLLSNEAVARVFKRLADRLQGYGVGHMHSDYYCSVLTLWKCISKKPRKKNLLATGVTGSDFARGLQMRPL